MKLRHAFLAAAAALAAAPGALLDGQPSAPATRAFTLLNGMRVTLVHVGSAPRAFVSLVLETGEIDEPAFGPGLASLTADILLEGTVSRSAPQIAAESERLGATLGVRAGPVTTTISGDVTAARLPRFLALVADLVRHPLLDTAAFERVRRAALRSLDSTMRNPADLARQQWRTIVFPEGPFGHPYSFATTLRQLQLGHVRNVYDDNYSASRAHLYVSGVFDAATVESSVRTIFSDWQAGTPARPRPIRAATVHELAVLDLPGAARSVTWIGLPVIDPTHRDFAKLEVADMLLAGADSSRVAIDLASLEGTAPRASSTLWQRRSANYWVAVLDVRAANTGAALRALIGELSVLGKEAPPEDEVARARRRVVDAFRSRVESRDGLVSVLEFMEEHALGEEWRAGYESRVMAVTPGDVRDAVAANLDPGRMAISVVGDKALIDPQLARLHPLVP